MLFVPDRLSLPKTTASLGRIIQCSTLLPNAIVIPIQKPIYCHLTTVAHKMHAAQVATHVLMLEKHTRVNSFSRTGQLVREDCTAHHVHHGCNFTRCLYILCHLIELDEQLERRK